MSTIKKELEYFRIEDSLGGNQDWFTEYMMNLGGCGAITASDTCLYLYQRFPRKSLCPFPEFPKTKEDYIQFADLMKPYLRPRRWGINSLELYMEGFRAYLKDGGEEALKLRAFSGHETFDRAKEEVKKSIDADFPVAYLNLLHQNPKMEDYVWHWFLLIGYEEKEGSFLVKTLTYGEAEWIDFEELWDNGKEEKGGMVLYFFPN